MQLEIEEDNVELCFQTKVDFTAWRGVLLCSLLVLAVCGLVTASIPTDRSPSVEEELQLYYHESPADIWKYSNLAAVH